VPNLADRSGRHPAADVARAVWWCVAIRNYGRNLRFAPRRVASPRTAAELAAIIRESGRVRAVGAGHSWSPGIVTDDTLVTLDRMHRVLALDTDRRQITVEAGMRLRELNAHLDRHGLALANLGSIDSQSVAGVIATGTHGTGRAYRCLSAQVAALDLIEGTGRAVRLERGDPDFDGAVVGLGALGIVHAVTFDVVDAFRLHDVTTCEPLPDLIERIDEQSAAVDHFKLWWLVPGDVAVVFRFDRTAEPATDSRIRRWFHDRVLGVAVYRSLLAAGHLSGRRWIPGINRFLTRAAGGLDRIVASHVGYLTPVPPAHAETEWAFDAANARDLLREYRQLLLRCGHTFNFVQEIRFSKADELWLSPAYRRDSIWLSLYNIDRRRWPEQLAMFEAFARAHGGRPHWGKQASFERAYLKQQYERLDQFAALSARFDPERRFRNSWLDSILDAA